MSNPPNPIFEVESRLLYTSTEEFMRICTLRRLTVNMGALGLIGSGLLPPASGRSDQRQRVLVHGNQQNLPDRPYLMSVFSDQAMDAQITKAARANPWAAYDIPPLGSNQHKLARPTIRKFIDDIHAAEPVSIPPNNATYLFYRLIEYSLRE